MDVSLHARDGTYLVDLAPVNIHGQVDFFKKKVYLDEESRTFWHEAIHLIFPTWEDEEVVEFLAERLDNFIYQNREFIILFLKILK